MSASNSLPVLYSFRRCPYAMRARMILAYSDIALEIREVVLKDKPEELIKASPKATVPVLVLEGNKILDESLDIMAWALLKKDPKNMNRDAFTENELIRDNDTWFKEALDRYKYADRYPEKDEIDYRAQGEVFLSKLDGLLQKNNYLSGERLSVIDIAIFPFIRQFAFVDKRWFDENAYINLKQWLEALLLSDIFTSIMPKLPQWQKGDAVTQFPFDTNSK